MDASKFQPMLYDPNLVEPQPILIENGRTFGLRELRALLECEKLEMVQLTDELLLIINEEGKLVPKPVFNLPATYLWYKFQPAARGQDCLVGRAILCHSEQFV